MDRLSKGMLPLRDILEKALRSQGLDKRIQQENAVILWEEIVGPRIAKASKAIKIERGELLIEVKSSSWKHQIQMLKPDIIVKLNNRLGKNIVKAIRFI